MPANRSLDPLTKIAHREAFSPAVFIDWLSLTVVLGTVVAAVTLLGGFTHFGPGAQEAVAGAGGLLLLHALWWGVNRERPAVNWRALLPLPFFAYAWWSLSTGPAPWLGRQQWLALAAGAVLYGLALHQFRRRWMPLALAGGLAAVGLLAALVALWQYTAAPEWLPLGRSKEEKHLLRASGFFAVPNHFAGLMLLTAPPCLLAAVRGREWPRWARLALALAGLAMLAGLVLSVSRGGYVGLAAVLLAAPLFLYDRWRGRLLGFLAAAGGGAAVAGTVYLALPHVRERVDQAFTQGGEVSRPFMWEVARRLWQDQPATGHGLGAYELLFDRHAPEDFAMRPEFAHNDYLNTLADTGLVGFLLLFGPAAYALWLGLRGWFTLPRDETPLDPRAPPLAPPERILCGGLVLGLIGFGVHLWFEFHLKYAGLLLPLGLALGLVTRWGSRRTTLRRCPRWVAALGVGAPAAVAAVLLVAGAYQTYPAARLTFISLERLNRYYDAPATPAHDERFLRTLARAFRDALKLDPQNGQAEVGLAQTLLELEARQAVAGPVPWEDEALALAHAAAVRSPGWWRPLSLRAVANGRRPAYAGRFAETVALHQAAVAAAPTNVLAWLYYARYLGQAALATGDKTVAEQALPALEKVLRLDPAQSDALSMREELLPLSQP